jgi:hypothetical protein
MRKLAKTKWRCSNKDLDGMGAVWRTECTKWKMSRTRWDLNLKLEKEIQLNENHRIGMHQKRKLKRSSWTVSSTRHRPFKVERSFETLWTSSREKQG